jgi:hypothetical protein
MSTRREILKSVPILIGACLVAKPFTSLFALTSNHLQDTQVTREDVAGFLNIANPAAHCNQNHNHQDNSYDNWEESLIWSAGDTGHNEGAAAVISLALQYGLHISGLPADLAGDAVGEIWKRRDMMAFAKDIAKGGFIIQATTIAVASQWHNCHAFRCLLRHTPETAEWLLS